jgi:uncharacterized protein YjgD (DUF1641 family)
MARSLDYTPRSPTPQQHLADAGAQNADALRAGVELLGSLHEHGVLDLLNKLVRGGSGLTGQTLHLLEGEGATRLIRTVLEAGHILADLDPRDVGTLGRALNAGVTEGARRAASGDKVSLGELLGLLRDPDIQVALAALFGTLKGFGQALRTADQPGADQSGPGQDRPA